MNNSTSLNPNPPKFVTGAQIRAGRALLGWRRTDLAAAAGLHRNSIAHWEGRTHMPRREPFACRKIRDALMRAGVVTVATPAPGVCLLKPEQQRSATRVDSGVSSLAESVEQTAIVTGV